ncbi:MAG: hypothetical protein R3B52_02505 [Candidatus Paceibacterota bacterium]
MKASPLKSEITLTALLLAGLFVFIDPFDLWMSSSSSKAIGFAIVAFLFLLIVFSWKQKARDERELLNSYFSDRLAYLVAISSLFFVFVYQVFMGLPAVITASLLALVVISKLIAVIFTSTFR